MSSSIVACLSIALRSVRESMVHDSEDRKKEAFCQYLSNIIYICGVLKDEAWQKDLRNVYSDETLKLFKLSSQCLDRAQDILKAGENNDNLQEVKPRSTPPLSRHVTTQHQPQDHVDHTSNQHNIQQNTLTTVQPVKHPTSPPPPVSPSFQRRMQYVEDARRGNSQLLSAYRARLERREKQMVNTRLSRKTDVTAMNLTLFRKMAENIEVAKTRQASLHRKNLERQQRLRDEADRRLGPSSLLTSDDQIKKELYVKVLEFEQETIWPVSLRDQLNARPDDTSLIQYIINRVLGTSEHPLTKYLKSRQYEIHQQLSTLCEQASDLLTHIIALENIQISSRERTQDKLAVVGTGDKNDSEALEETSLDDELCDVLDSKNSKPNEGIVRQERNTETVNMEVDFAFPEEKKNEYKNALETVVKKVQFSLEMFHALFLIVYEPLSSATGQDLCLASVESTFFKPLWPLLLNLYRLVNYQREASLTRVFRTNASCTPNCLKVPDRLCLIQSSDDENQGQPYQLAVDELQSLKTFNCPLEKLECIVRTNRIIVECVEDYYEAKGKPRNSPETVIGCDDLLPILSYVIIRSFLPQLVSECHAMEDFISADYLMGEEGYSLTTFQTVLAYLETLDTTDKSCSNVK